MRKILISALCLAMAASCLVGCNTSKKAKGKNNAPEATTQEKGSEKYKPDLFAKDLMNYDISKIVTLPKDYRNMTVSLKGAAEYSEEGLNAFINEMFSGAPKYEKVNKAKIERDDVVEIDYTEDSGEKGEEQKGVKITIGNDEFGTGFDNTLIGKKVGDSFDELFEYPDTFSDEYAGKEVHYTGKITGIYKAVPVTVDNVTDDYIKEHFGDVYNCENLKEFKKSMKAEYENKLYYDRTAILQERVLKKLVKESTFHISKDMEKKEIEKQLAMHKKNAEGEDMDFEDYLKNQLGMDEKTLRKEIASSYKNKLVVDAMIKDQNFGISSKEFEEAMSVYLSYGYASLDDVYDVFGGKDEMLLSYAENKMLETFTNSVYENSTKKKAS